MLLPHPMEMSTRVPPKLGGKAWDGVPQGMSYATCMKFLPGPESQAVNTHRTAGPDFSQPSLASGLGVHGAVHYGVCRLSKGLPLPPVRLREGAWLHRRAVLPSSQFIPECPGQHLHSRAVTVLYITLYVGLTTVL